MTTVYTVHVVKPADVGAVEIVFTTEDEARRYAASRSQDHHVLAASVSRFAVGQLGTRSAVAWYADGAEQDQRKPRPGKIYPAEC